MKRVAVWVLELDWAAFIGTALFALFYVGVIDPVMVGLPVIISHQQPAYGQEYRQGQYESPEVVGSDGANDRVADYTLWLTIFTALLVAVSGWQGYLILRAEGGTRESLRIASAQAEAAKENARNLLRATRPKIAMTDMLLQAYDGGAVPNIAVEPGQELRKVTGNFRNEGTAKAFIVDFNFTSQMGDLGAPLGLGDWQISAGGYEPIEPGATFFPVMGFGPAVFDPNSSLLNSMFFWGWVRYEDIHQIRRRAGFAFVYFTGINMFHPDGDSRYWYDIEEEAED